MTLTAVDLACGYGRRAILDRVSVTLRPGELTVVLGPNGVGKTTFLKTMCGLIRPLRGQVSLGGQELESMSTRRLAQEIAYAPQVLSADWPFTVREFVRLARTPHRGWWRPLTTDDHRLVDEAIERLCVLDLADALVTELSGGEWQRVRLASAIARESPWLLFDEPTAHLDPRAQWEFLTAVRGLVRERGLGVVLSLHDLNLVGPWADRVVLFAAGRLQADGSPAEVLTAEVLGDAYRVRLAVADHPITRTPVIAVAPEE